MSTQLILFTAEFNCPSLSGMSTHSRAATALEIRLMERLRRDVTCRY